MPNHSDYYMVVCALAILIEVIMLGGALLIFIITKVVKHIKRTKNAKNTDMMEKEDIVDSKSTG